MKNEKIDMGRESDTFHVSQDGVYTITGTNSRHGITVSAGVLQQYFCKMSTYVIWETWVLHFILRKTAISR